MYKSKIFKFNGSYKYKFCYDFCQKKKHFLCFVKLSRFYPSFTEVKSQIDAKKQDLFP